MINEQIATYTQNIMNDVNLTIVIGRENYEYLDFNSDLILIDSLTKATPISNLDSYNGDDEIQTFHTIYEQLFTFDFYGDNAYSNAQKFIALNRSEKALWEMKATEITAFYPNGITDLKNLFGTQQSNRFQVEATINYKVDVSIETLRIDTIQHEIKYVEE